ncbi:MAG: glucosamine-6-phosphate deaminase [Chloroflexi bacterium]|nr:glucosamine-6-phosphate deaminase [Chloroflexota bacterium]
MRLFIFDDYQALSRAGAALVAEVVAARPTAALVLATGVTPMGLYQELAERRDRGAFDTSQLRIFQLDEYLGLGPDDQRSLFLWMKRAVLAPWAITPANVARLPGNSSEPQVACRVYDRAIEAVGGFDLAVLGLGSNGHLGFNEPPADPTSRTHIVALTEASVESNARYWGGRDQVPRQALTVGLAWLLAARHILLVVSGEHKRAILRRVVEGPVSPETPASYLQKAANVTVIADKAAWGDITQVT